MSRSWLLFSRGSLPGGALGRSAHESRAFLDGQFAGDDVAVEDRVLLQFAAVCHRDVAFDFAKDDHGSGLDVPDDPGVLPDSEVTFGVHFSLDTDVDDEVAGKAKPAATPRY